MLDRGLPLGQSRASFVASTDCSGAAEPAANFASLGRAMLADPDCANKARENRLPDIESSLVVSFAVRTRMVSGYAKRDTEPRHIGAATLGCWATGYEPDGELLERPTEQLPGVEAIRIGTVRAGAPVQIGRARQLGKSGFDNCERVISNLVDIDTLFNDRHFSPRNHRPVCALVRYLRYKLSFRHLVEIMAEPGPGPGPSLAPTTIICWVKRCAPEFVKR